MKIKIKLMVIFGVFCVFLMMQPSSVFSELIGPSRTIKGLKNPKGRLSVFSEPPELDVLLDGVNIGKTPIFSKEVSPGTHLLRVKKTEKEIIILPGKYLQVSLYKGSLIEIPEKKDEALRETKSEEKTTIQEKKTKYPEKDMDENDPFYWPMNPTGPIE
jgi:hypothetical protein